MGILPWKLYFVGGFAGIEDCGRPYDLYFEEVGHHRMAFTRSGTLIDSHVGETLQLEDGVKYKHRDITYTLEGIGQDKPTISYPVRFYPRIGKAVLIRK